MLFAFCPNLSALYFTENSPSVGSNWVSGDDKSTTHYNPGTTGFTTPTWYGLPCYPPYSASAPLASPISLNITSPSSVEYTNDTSTTVDWTITDTASTVNNVEISDDNGGTWTNVTHDTSYTFNGLSDGQYAHTDERHRRGRQ